MKKNKPGTLSTNYMFPKLDAFFEKKQDTIFYLSLFLLILFGILLFDLRISVGGDDSGYLMDAKKFADGKKFPTWHGIFYVMFIGWVIKLFGFNLALFKGLSLVFIIGHQILFYKAIKNRLSPFLVAMILLILSVNSGILYYSSQTYSEAFYLLLQGLFLFVFINYMIDPDGSLKGIKKNGLLYAVLGFSIFILSLAKNLGVVALAVAIIYFVANRKYYSALITTGVFLVFKALFALYKKVVWNIDLFKSGGQLSEITLKDPYNPGKGKEDFVGMLERVLENTKIYLSRVFMQEVGLKEYTDTSTNLFVSLLIVLLLLAGLILAYKKKDNVAKILYLYIGGSLAGTFIALQQMWAQTRMILPYLHLIVLCSALAIGMLATYKKFSKTRLLAPVLVIAILLLTFGTTVKKSQDHQEILTKNLSGNRYYGYTPDWVHFLKMSEWVSKKVDKDIMVVSRKPAMSFIYGKGREFYPMYRIPFEVADTIMAAVHKTDKNVYFIKEAEFRNKPAGVVYTIKADMYAAISADNVLYGVYFIDSGKVGYVDSILEANKMNANKNVDDFKKNILDKAKSTTGINPDKLLNRLKDNNVQYIIMASLRVNPKMKTDRTINTVARYISAIQLKYPGIFLLAHQIGAEENEPAKLYRIDYNRIPY